MATKQNTIPESLVQQTLSSFIMPPSSSSAVATEQLDAAASDNVANLNDTESFATQHRDRIVHNGVCIFISEDGDFIKPKRALTAYNFFFQEQRRIMLEEASRNGIEKETGHAAGPSLTTSKKIGFSAMAKEVSARWKVTEEADKEYFSKLAEKDLARQGNEEKESQEAKT